ncbi:MAG: AMP-binding protein [Nitrospirae bacterium]|jgi:long-chain acyl-CoA synthetase|nr:AMP-binding protein [Nitrospirota bacterium]
MKEATIPESFLQSATQHKDNIAFYFFDNTWKEITYNELLVNVKGAASYLIGQGIKKGDRIAIIAENRPEWCMAYLAISMSGAIAVPIDVQLGPDEIKNLLFDSESKIVFHSTKTEENISKACSELIGQQDSNITQINFDTPEVKELYRTSGVSIFPEIFEDDVASLIYTSGTTGIPKGVLLTHKNFCSDADAVVKAEIITYKDNVISVLPLHHTYPFTCTFLIPVFLGITITYPPGLKGLELMSTINEKRVTVLVGVPQLLELVRNGIFNKLKQLPGPMPQIMFSILKFCGALKKQSGLNMGKLVFKSVHRPLGKQFRFFASGGAKLNPEVMKDLEALGFTVVEGYGLTETSPVVTFNPVEKRKPGSVGKPLPSVKIKIIDPEKHTELGEMKDGEITIKGPMVMKGYYKNPEATQEVLKNGWFFSGDIGYLDNEGYLFITGRLKEVIVLSSGKNIYPDELEKKYLKIPLLKEICILGVEDKGIVESLHAVIVPDIEYAKKAQIGNLQEAFKWEINNISLHLPEYMRIKGYTISPGPLPRTPLGKLRRFMVKDLIKAKGEGLRAKSEDRKLLEDGMGRKVVECITPLLKEKIPIQSTDNLELDLGLDSLAKIELVASLEKSFSVKLPDTFASGVQTVEELVAKIKEYGVKKVSDFEAMPSWKDILTAEPDFEDRKKVGLHHNVFEWVIIIIAIILLKIIFKTFFRLKVEGLEKLPEKGPYIITPNHTSYLDGFCVTAALPLKSFGHLYSLGFQKYFTGGLKESFARLAHVIPVDPETYLSKALQMSSYILRNGKSLMIFPEGGRSYDGELLEFKKGVGILSAELNVPVIPAYIKGTFEALPRGFILPKFKRISIKFVKPLYPSDMDFSKKAEGMDDYQFFVNELRKRIKELGSNYFFPGQARNDRK